MKKFLTAFLLIVSVICASGGLISYANTNTNTNSKVSGTVTAKNIKGLLEDISYISHEGYEQVQIKASGYSDYSTMVLEDPLRIVIDLENLSVPEGIGNREAGGKYVNRVRYSQFTSSAGRVVLDVNKGYDYSIEETDTGLAVAVYKKKSSEELKEDNAIMFGESYGISHTGIGKEEAVTIKLGEYEKYNVSRLTGPERLVVTIDDAAVFGTDKQLEINSDRVSYINYNKADDSGATITIGLTAQFQYNVDETDDKLVLTFVWPSYKNIMYNNSQDRVHFLVKDAELTQGTRYLKPLYEDSLDDSGTVYTVTFPSDNADVDEGILDINDAYLRSFEVKKNKDGTTSFIFCGHAENSYLVYTRESGDTAITVIKPAPANQKLVVIDPGHGGTATGAAYGSMKEKDLNLDISKRLDELLESKGVKTYMLRTDDSNVDNYERAYIANMLGAKLYMSVHNNAINSKSFRGVMTLYYPSASSRFNGKDFAKIVQKDLVTTLKSIDRNIRSRPDLIVLRETDMPAVIAEIAFITNAQDRANLRTESFRQKAAQSLYNSIMKALEKV